MRLPRLTQLARSPGLRAPRVRFAFRRAALPALLAVVLGGCAAGCRASKLEPERSAASGSERSRASDPAGSQAPTAWPELPRTEQAAWELVAARTLRTEVPVPDSELEADALLRRLTGPGPQWSAVVAGEEGTRSCVQGVLDRATAGRHDAFVLFGTFHDAPGQIDAFRWLIGPGGLRHLTAVAAEQFRATGAWRGVPPEAQRGDDADIAAYLEHGERGAFERLAERHRESDYAAWKLGYEPSVLELLVTARADERGAHGARFTGCDMPTRTQELVAALPDEARRRLREIHCLMALAALDEPARATRGASKSGASPRPAARVAMIWGQAHVQSIRRFLPPSADVLSLYVFGYRPGDETTEAKLARHLALVDPVIVPLNARGDVAALLYPDAVLGASVDRVRERADDAGGANVPPLHDAGGRVVFALAGPTRGRLVVGERAIDLVPAPGLAMAGVTLDLPPGDHVYLLEVGDLRFVGSARVSRGGHLAISFDPAHRSVSYTEAARAGEGRARQPDAGSW